MEFVYLKKIRKDFSAVSVTEHRHRFPREAVGSPSMDDIPKLFEHGPGQLALDDPS